MSSTEPPLLATSDPARNAAGGQTNLTLEQTVKKFLDLLPQYKDQLLAD